MIYTGERLIIESRLVKYIASVDNDWLIEAYVYALHGRIDDVYVSFQCTLSNFTKLAKILAFSCILDMCEDLFKILCDDVLVIDILVGLYLKIFMF